MGQMTMLFLRINVLFKAFIRLKLGNYRKSSFIGSLQNSENSVQH